MIFDIGNARLLQTQRRSELFWLVAFLHTLTSRHSNTEMSIPGGGYGRLCLVPGPFEPVTTGVRYVYLTKLNKNIKEEKE
jgi:hypothetical protein